MSFRKSVHGWVAADNKVCDRKRVPTLLKFFFDRNFCSGGPKTIEIGTVSEIWMPLAGEHCV